MQEIDYSKLRVGSFSLGSCWVLRRPLVKEPIEERGLDVYLSKQGVRYSPMLEVNSDS